MSRSAAQPLAPPRERKVDHVRSWRMEQLVQAGYPRREAALLSALPDVDLHVAVSLLSRGCPLETALAILL